MRFPREPDRRPSSALGVLALLALAPLAAGQQRPRAEVEPPDEPHSYSIPETRVAKARLDAATEHIAARRWSEALEELQRLIEDHRGEMLAGERQLPGRARPSEQPVHPGASERARTLLYALPPEARELYRARHAARAAQALAQARSTRDRRALAEVGRRWPITSEAERAWWSLGDLELEEGRPREAREAWGRALGVRLLRAELAPRSPDEWNELAGALELSAISAAGESDEARAAAARARGAAALAADNATEGARDEAEAQGSLVASLAGRRAGQGPGRGASSWAQPWRFPDQRTQRTLRVDALFPVRSGELVFVNTPLRVTALNAWTGALAWESEEPEGWSRLTSKAREELFKAVDDAAALYAPAANARVVIGVQQLPFALGEVQTYSHMEITRPIPERRLFAYEAATGRPLWDHRPPPGWDGGPTDPERRMIVAGPPVIRGDRVLAPLYRLEGRIDYHVGCFDVDTGEALWTRAVVSGQRELNMFGRPPHEFCAPPLAVDDARVYALTQLGTIACLDLFSGDVLWQTRYEQIAIPRNSGMEATELQNVWRPALPVIVGRALVATPFDSRDMVALDTTTGAQIWSLPASFFVTQGAARGASSELYFAGADERSVYVQGSTLLGLTSRAGLERDAPRAATLQFTHADLRNPSGLGRPVLAGSRLVVPLQDGRVDLELPGGRALPPIPWALGLAGGNLLVGRGELFTVSRNGVVGYFEWEQMAARARAERARAPADPRAAGRLAQLLASSAENSLAEGRSEGARATIEEARVTLDEFATLAGRLPPELAAELHRVLRLEARVWRSLASGDRARAALRRARDCAPTREELCNTLLEELASAEGRPAAERAGIVAELEARVADSELECIEPVDPRSPDERDPLAWVPLVGSQARDDAEAHRVLVPVGAWVLFDRALEARRAHDVAGELAALECVLGSQAEVELIGGTSGEFARARIGQLFATSAAASREGYEARAQAELQAARARGDREALARIGERYPFSRAAAAANDARVELALERGEPAELLAILSAELRGEWSPARAGARELELCVRAALGFERAGNRELAAEFLRTLAEARPDARPGAPEASGRTLAELAAGLERWQAPESAPAIGSFQPDGARLWALAGSFQVLGRSVPEQPGDERLVLIVGSEPSQAGCSLRAWSKANLEAPLWSARASAFEELARQDASAWRARSAFARGRVLLAGSSTVQAFDERSGAGAWEWTLAEPELECSGLTVAAGIALVALQPSDAGGAAGDLLQALDAHSGAPLWRITTPVSGVRALPLCSSNLLVFLPPTGTSDVRVHDLFTGAFARGFALGAPAPARIEDDAWIEGERLVVPWIDHSRTSRIEAWNLATAKRAWQLEFEDAGGERRQLSGVLQHGARTWLYVRTMSPDKNPQLFELSSGIGALAPLSNVRLAPQDRLLGTREQRRRRLAAPELYVFSERPGNRQESRVRCIDLAQGERWATTLQLPWSEVSSGQSLTPSPALAEACVALAYAPAGRADRLGNVGANVLFLDRANGLVRADKRSLGQEGFGRSMGLEFVALGDGLLVRGERRLEMWR